MMNEQTWAVLIATAILTVSTSFVYWWTRNLVKAYFGSVVTPVSLGIFCYFFVSRGLLDALLGVTLFVFVMTLFFFAVCYQSVFFGRLVQKKKIAVAEKRGGENHEH